MHEAWILCGWEHPATIPNLTPGTERDCHDYNSDGTYATTQYDFTDKSKRNPVKAVLRDPDGQRLMEAD